MATYNGEKYLREQIDSILLQSNRDWVLYIHDDGSTDRTLWIIKEYVNSYDNIVFLQDPVMHRGAYFSFMWLLENVTADYYMFCDQDDIWDKNKIQLSIETLILLEKKNSQKALLVCTNLYVVNYDNSKVYGDMWNYNKQIRILQSEFLKVGTLCTGCTMIFNHILKEIALNYIDCSFMHDALLAACAYKFGSLQFLNIPTVLYRQHDKNVLGVRKFNIWNFRILNVRKKYKKDLQYYKLSHKIIGTSFGEYFYLRCLSSWKMHFGK